MKQLALPLSSAPEPTFETFVAARNAEAVATLRALSAGASGERFVYLWGCAGSGRSHLLSAVAHAVRQAGRALMQWPAAVGHAPLAAVASDDLTLIVDDVERLDAPAQETLFGLYNRIRDHAGAALVAAGNAPPARLAVRVDLATRLAWGLVYEVRALSDEEKLEAMRAHAVERGFVLATEVQQYVLRHAPRDLRSLLALIEHLDRSSLETRRPVTVPLVREILQQMHR